VLPQLVDISHKTVDRLAPVAMPRFVIHRIEVWDVRKPWIGC